VLGQRVIFDLPTARIALGGFGLLLKYRLQEPVLVAVTGLAGLVPWPLLAASRLRSDVGEKVYGMAEIQPISN